MVNLKAIVLLLSLQLEQRKHFFFWVIQTAGTRKNITLRKKWPKYTLLVLVEKNLRNITLVKLEKFTFFCISNVDL